MIYILVLVLVLLGLVVSLSCLVIFGRVWFARSGSLWFGFSLVSFGLVSLILKSGGLGSGLDSLKTSGLVFVIKSCIETLPSASVFIFSQNFQRLMIHLQLIFSNLKIVYVSHFYNLIINLST